MKNLAELTKTTLIGGLLVVLPIYFSILLLAKTLSGLLALVGPITAQIPATVELRQLAAILVVLVVCFVAGLLVRTGPGLRAKNAIERTLLEKIPGYTFIRGFAARLSGDEQEQTFIPALVRFDDGLAPAFVVEELDDGRYTVLVPSVPTPAAGALWVMDRDRVQLLEVPLTSAIRVVSKWGVGTRELVAGTTK